MIFLPSEKANSFIIAFSHAYNKAVQNEEDVPEPKIDNEQFEKSKIIFTADRIKSVTVYFNPYNGLEFYPDIAECIDKKRKSVF